MLNIEKKIFPKPQTLSSIQEFCTHRPEKVLFFDIETTGLSRERCHIYLIGCLFVKDDAMYLRQWMAEGAWEEEKILKGFLEFSKSFSLLIHYNGKKFDIPFTEHRLLKHGLFPAFSDMEALDIYQKLCPCKGLLGLSHMRQPDIEQFLFDNKKRMHCDGGACISLYKKYCHHPTREISMTLLGHNEEDLRGLAELTPALSYPALLNGEFKTEQVQREQEQVCCFCSLKHALPRPVSFVCEDSSLTAKDVHMKIELRLRNGQLRQRYPDYKQYFYLPSEDTAVHRALISCVDASLRIPASRETCYTWFPCNEDFVKSPKKAEEYLRKNLPLWLTIFRSPS